MLQFAAAIPAVISMIQGIMSLLTHLAQVSAMLKEQHSKGEVKLTAEQHKVLDDLIELQRDYALKARSPLS